MSDLRLADPPRPRIEIEEATSPRLEALVSVPVVSAEAAGRPHLLLAGAACLVFGFTGLAAGNFVASQFDRAAWLGWLTLGIAASGFGMLGAGTWRELRALFRLGQVDRLRADLASGEVKRMRRAARVWLAGIADGKSLLPGIEATQDAEAILALLRAGPGAALRARADALGRTAALQIFGATAAIPSPSLDGLLVAWRGVRLIRAVAELHGLRPGLLGTLALLRRTLLSAASVAATDLAADVLTRAALSNPLLQHLAGDAAGAGIAARRTLVLARATALACSPLP